MCAGKFEYVYTKSMLVAFIVVLTFVIHYYQNQSDSNQRKWLSDTFFNIPFSSLSQDIMKVWNIYNGDKI